MKFLLLSLLVAVSYTLGDALATKYFETNIWWWILGGVLFNAIGVCVFGYVAHYLDMSVSSGIILCANIILNVAIGIYFFGDKLHHMQWAGLLCCLLGIVLLYSYEYDAV